LQAHTIHLRHHCAQVFESGAHLAPLHDNGATRRGESAQLLLTAGNQEDDIESAPRKVDPNPITSRVNMFLSYERGPDIHYSPSNIVQWDGSIPRYVVSDVGARS